MKRKGVFFLMIFLAIEMVYPMENEGGYYDFLLEDSEDIFPKEILEPAYNFAQVVVGVDALDCTSFLPISQESLHFESAKQDKKRKANNSEKKQAHKRVNQGQQFFKHYLPLEQDRKKDKKRAFECLQCRESFPLSQENSHKSWHENKGYICHYCLLSFPDHSRLKGHNKTSRCKKKKGIPQLAQEENEYLCSKGCGYTTIFASNLTVHEKQEHNKQYICIHCKDDSSDKNIFTSRGALLRHVHEDHQVSSVCHYDRCGYVSDSKRAMRNHQQDTVHRKLHKCPFCSVFLSSVSGFRQHKELCKDKAA